MIPALIVYGIEGLISGVVSLISREPYPWILWGRIIQGFGAAGTSPIAMALGSDTFSTTEKSKALGIMEASNGVGKVVSPVLGSLVAMITWYLIFFTYSFLTISIGVMIWFIIKEERSHAERKNLIRFLGIALGPVFFHQLLQKCSETGSIDGYGRRTVLVYSYVFAIRSDVGVFWRKKIKINQG